MAELSANRPLRQIIADEIHRLNPEHPALISGTVSAILDAVADGLMPEEPLPHGPGQKERARLRAVLSAEADQAELGDA